MNFKKIKMAILRRVPLRRLFYGSCGKKSLIYNPLLITNKKNIYMGDNVFFRDGARIEIIKEWQNQKFDSKLVIGSNTSFEQNSHITSAGSIKIGHDCVFSARTMITNINHDYKTLSTNVLKQKLICNDVVIGDYCFVGMDVKIFPGVTIGDNVIIGANSIVMHDIPSYCVAVGCPAKVIKKYNFDSKEWERCD